MITPNKFFSVVALVASFPAGSQTSLSCPDVQDEPAQIARLASQVVSRSNGRLFIKLPGRRVEFLNRQPRNAPMSGDAYAFCDRKDGYILVKLARGSLFTGVLVRESDGVVLPAGLTAVFSPDRRAYFSTEQPDGLEGQNWLIRDASGRASWKGHSFIPVQQDPDQKLIELQSPKWTSTGEFTATASCVISMDVQWEVKLVRRKDGSDWQWSPTRQCK